MSEIGCDCCPCGSSVCIECRRNVATQYLVQLVQNGVWDTARFVVFGAPVVDLLERIAEEAVTGVSRIPTVLAAPVAEGRKLAAGDGGEAVVGEGFKRGRAGDQLVRYRGRRRSPAQGMGHR